MNKVDGKSPIYQNEGSSEPTKKTKAQSKWSQAALIMGTLLIIPSIAAEIFKMIQETIHEKKHGQSEQTLVATITAKFGEEVAEIAQNTDLIARSRIMYRLAFANEKEIKIVNYIMNNYDLTSDQRKKILGGAHVRLEDDGKTYETWSRDLVGGVARISSHPADGTQYGLQGYFLKELLYGKVTENGKTYSWFQLENNPVSIGNVIRHTVDYIKYRISGKNQGPYGASNHTDKNALVLKPKEAAIAA